MSEAHVPTSPLDEPSLRRFGMGWTIFRGLYALALLTAAVFGLLEFPSELQRQLYTIAVVIFAVPTFAVPFVTRVASSRSALRFAWLWLGVDLVALMVVAFTTEKYEDLAFPMFIGLSLFYASIAHERRMWFVSMATGGTYLIGHLGHWLLIGERSVDLTFAIAKAALIIALTGFLGEWLQQRAERERELDRNRLEIASLNDSLTRRIAELHIVAEISEVIHSTLDFDSIGPIVLESLKKAIDMPSCSLMVVDRKSDQTVFSASSGLNEDGIEPPMTGYFPSPDGLLEADVSGPMFTCTNIIEHNEMGVVFCCPADRLDSLTEDDMLVLQAVSSELVVAVENSRLYQLTKRLSITDELTGLRNYRFFQQRLDQEYERANRYNRYLSLLMLDIDHFKEVNDRHGHIAGDQVLSDMAGIFNTCVREVDVVARYGGEEFGIILPETDAAGAFVVAEKIREGVSNFLFADSDGERAEHVTVSIGVATFPVHALDREGLLRQADDALYQAKHFGRDRVRAPKIANEA